MAELKLGTNSEGGKILCLVLKSWLTILQMEKDKLLRFCHDWHTGNMKSGSWKRKLRDELEKVTLEMHLAKPKRGMARHILCIVTKA